MTSSASSSGAAAASSSSVSSGWSSDLARSNHGRSPNRRIGVGRVTPLKLAGQLDLRRVCVRHRDRLDLSVGEQVHGAPVGQARNGEGGQPIERRLDVQGLGQQLAGLGRGSPGSGGPVARRREAGPDRARTRPAERWPPGRPARRARTCGLRGKLSEMAPKTLPCAQSGTIARERNLISVPASAG